MASFLLDVMCDAWKCCSLLRPMRHAEGPKQQASTWHLEGGVEPLNLPTWASCYVR